MNETVRIVSLSGSFNTNSSSVFQQDIDKLIASGAKFVLIDCQGVTFMDSSGLGALVLAFKKLQDAGIKMAICSINEQVRILFELTNMDNIFEIFPTQEAFQKVAIPAN
ncbi:stage II sporulation protein [Richelia sinica FACHB-800]|uniref:Anti-sigma factor antagonist n=1 Tax=Richelia sinica FACHB-800 TaxID=1357546 RepID=A0A975T467_9NOST|nr:STAS domain-containing protein [Richelia sinica]MBD2662933.1 STAS domain-containing protein [Richelia sinica FACHB-800]QXE21775.1 stage II sporulation protein [Richelia sinica FACHB-800]